MSSPQKTIKKSSRRNHTPANLSSSSKLERSQDVDLEASPVTPAKGEQLRKSISRRGQGKARKKLDFSTLDIRAIAASANTISSISTIGHLTKTIQQQSEAGKVSGSLSVSLCVFSTRIRKTKGGSKYVLFVDETGFLSLCVSAKKASVLEESGEEEIAADTQHKAASILISGKVNYQPSSSNEDEFFIALDWNAKLQVFQINNEDICATKVPVCLNCVLFATTEERNKEMVIPVLIANLMTVQADHAKKEVTLSLADCTGYAFINVTNAPNNIRQNAEDEEELGPLAIIGAIECKPVSTIVVNGIAATVDFEKCSFVPLSVEEFDKHTTRISKIPEQHFQFKDPFLEC